MRMRRVVVRGSGIGIKGNHFVCPSSSQKPPVQNNLKSTKLEAFQADGLRFNGYRLLWNVDLYDFEFRFQRTKIGENILSRCHHPVLRLGFQCSQNFGGFQIESLNRTPQSSLQFLFGSIVMLLLSFLNQPDQTSRLLPARNGEFRNRRVRRPLSHSSMNRCRGAN